MWQPCMLCGSNEENDNLLGQLGIQAEKVMHRNCLILCFGKCVQTKNAQYRMRHFFKHDFLIEIRRFQLLKCEYCRLLEANLTCCHVGCKRSFHTKCGLENMAMLQYGGQFDTFCAEHVPEHHQRPVPEDHCVLCLDPVVNVGEDFKPALAFQAPCCQNGWFHRACVQELSNTSTTYSLMCPLCRDEDRFAEVAMYGVAIPKWNYALPEAPAALAARARELERPQINYSHPINPTLGGDYHRLNSSNLN